LNAKQASQTFALDIGSGQVDEALTFSKLSSLTLTITAADGTVVASASGSSVLKLTKTLGAGSYRFKVGGSGKAACSFILALNYANP
jgi:hypothetical protein